MTDLYRERVEVYGVTPEGTILGGLRNDHSFGTFGGGVEQGETVFQAAQREFQEEANYGISNLRLLPVEPLVQPWFDNPEERSFREHEYERRRSLYPRGTRTHYCAGDLGSRFNFKAEDTFVTFKDVRLRSLQIVIALQYQALQTLTCSTHRDRMERRLQALKSLER
jgi:8-oxo-dGTP pyrophosphatase MutT (NUDIX family)